VGEAVSKISEMVTCPWLMPVTIATWEAELKRITVGGQPGQMFTRPPSPK
jgi:hypothetical protein